jgi:hypothetical protein
MIKRELMSQIKWLLLAIIILFLSAFFDGTVVINSNAHLALHTFLGLNIFGWVLFGVLSFLLYV